MSKYEVLGVGYNESGHLTEYLKTFGEFETPGEAIVFAHEINADWLKMNGNVPEEVTAVDVNVELKGEEPLSHKRINIYHNMNFGLQPLKAAV